MDPDVDESSPVTLKNKPGICPNIKGETAMNKVVTLNRDFITSLEALEKPSCPSISITDLCLKVSSTFYDSHFNIPIFDIKHTIYPLSCNPLT